MGIITDKEMNAKANGTDQWFIDPAPRGSGRFLGRITANGERLFYFRYTTGSGQRDTMPIGPYDQKGKDGYLTLAKAREKAASWSKFYRDGAKDLRQHLAMAEEERLKSIENAKLQSESEELAAGIAAQDAELERQRRLTVRQVFERWASSELKPHVGGDGKRIGRRDGGQYVREQFERHVFPTLGNVALMDVRKPGVLAILDGVKSEGKLRTANVLLADLKQMFRFAAEREIIEHSPIDLVRKRKIGGKDVKRDRVLSNDELIALAKQLPAAKLGKRSELAIWIVLATGCRIGELMGAAWAESEPNELEMQLFIDTKHAIHTWEAPKLGFVDLVQRTWYLPTTKNQRDHTIHLSDFAAAKFGALAEMREVDSETGELVPWIFPASNGKGPVCIKSFSKQLADRQISPEKRMKNRSKACDALILDGGRWTAHDLRRTTSTMMSQLHISGDVINECENHIKQGMSGIYIQDRREAEQAVAYDTVGQKLTELLSVAN